MDMMTETPEKKIPYDVMNYQHIPDDCFNKMQWIGNEMIRIINDEGMEKLIDIGTDF
jgi:hypothetical protein